MTPTRPHRLSARAFYAVIAAGVLLGVVAAGAAAWAQQRPGLAPPGRRIWADVADRFVVPVAAMMGGTFGGIAGFAAAVLLDRRR